VRVIHVAPTPFGGSGLLGGGERYPLELGRALAGDVDCELVTFGARPALHRDPSGLRIRVLRPLMRIGGVVHPVALRLPFVLRGADVVHTHHLRSVPSRMAALAAVGRRQAVVTTDHGLGGGGWGGLLPALFDRFLTVSASSAATLGVPPEKVRVVYGGVDVSRFTPEPAEPRQGVLFVGRITPHKGIDRLLAALPAGVPLTIVGSTGHDPAPPERDYPDLLASLVEGRDVRFLGPLPDEALAAQYRRAGVLVLPSVSRTCYGREHAISELLGLVALEAMASATPVVCSDIGGLPEVVAHDETGFLVPPGDVGQLRDRIAEVLADPDRAARMGAAGRRRVLERFTWAACARRCLDAYAELVDDAASRSPR
jgi:glycosyltransferase involved in cell wall biosynthesis